MYRDRPTKRLDPRTHAEATGQDYDPPGGVRAAEPARHTPWLRSTHDADSYYTVAAQRRIPPSSSRHSSGAVMWEKRINQAVGTRVHRLVGMIVALGAGPEDVVRATREMFEAEPLGGAVAASVRSRCVGLASLYLTYCVPVGWELVGIEERMAHSQPDLIWWRDGAIVLEEIKTGRPTMTSPGTADQVRRQHDDGLARWGTRFGGVRVITLGSPHRSWMIGPTNGRARRTVMPSGLEIR